MSGGDGQTCRFSVKIKIRIKTKKNQDKFALVSFELQKKWLVLYFREMERNGSRHIFLDPDLSDIKKKELLIGFWDVEN
jgi:hypothetical protein